MENRRRRRRMKSDEDSEDQSNSESASLSDVEAEEDKDVKVVTPLSERVSQGKSAEEGFDSPSEFIDEEGGEEGRADIEVEGDFLEGDALDLSDDYDGVCVGEERQQGDGEECSTSSAPEKILDYDEDKRNPQYIPKKGTFYEHDDRNNEVLKEKEVEISREKKKKKLWLDEGKWGHDRYREEEQYPKSREELIEIYGYDIRNEDGPPRARRRRRYGRGPTKYQRNWEDENAYGKERSILNPGFGGGRPRGRPQTNNNTRGRSGLCYKIISSDNGDTESPGSVNHVNLYSKSSKVSNQSLGEDDGSKEKCFDSSAIDVSDFPALPKRQECEFNESAVKIDGKSPPVTDISVEDSVKTQTFENSSFVNNPQMYKEHSSKQGRNITSRSSFKNAHKKPSSMRSQRGNGRGSYKEESDIKVASDKKSDLISLMSFGMEKLTVCDKFESDDENINSPSDEKGRLHVKKHGNVSKQSNSGLLQPSRSSGDTSSRPKRYSSLRQRGLTETQGFHHSSTPHLAPPHGTFFDSSYQTIYTTPEAVASNTQSQTPGSPPLINTAYQNFTPSHYPDGYGMRMPVNNAPRLFPQVTLPTGQPVLATQCITPNTNIMNFAAPPQPTGYAPFTYQQYSAPPPPPPPPPGNQPADLYAPGITYYYTQGQPHPIRPIPQKRPKAAIPILPPPDTEVKFSCVKDKKQLDTSCILAVNSKNISDGDSAVALADVSVQMQSAVEVES